ncbi:MAG TPA: sulfite exporter TauE/SafE family protein [Aestuariivirga sp.]|nr:sulfite exporter TauE/SafE family protein [Aestuariivirga sp.]
MTGDIAFYLLAALAAFTVGLSKGGLPMVGMLGVPLLALSISPIVAAALLLPIFVLSDMFGLYVYRRAFDRRNLAILIPAATLGIAIGWATASITREWLVTLIVGIIGLSYCINALVTRGGGEARSADLPRGVFWGTIAGFTSFVSHSGAPPYQMYVLPQRLDKMTFAGTSTIFFAVVNAIKLIPYWALGQFTTGNLKVAAVLAPVAVAGIFLGFKLVKIIPEKAFFRFVEVALAVVSVKLVFDALFKA